MKLKIVSSEKFLKFFDQNDSLWLQDRVPYLLDKKEGTLVRSSRFTTVLEFKNPKTGVLFYFKEFHDRDVMEKLKAIFRSTRAKRAYEAGKQLLKHGFYTPIPLMYGVRKSFCLYTTNFLITTSADGENTYKYFETRFPLPLSVDSFNEKRALIKTAGHEIGRLHRTGFFHGDLRVGNIIIQEKGSSAKFFIIDNERTIYCKSIPERKRIKNLVQINMARFPQITKSDRLRFLNAYISENPLLLSSREELIRKIHYLTERRHYYKSIKS